MGKKQQMSYLVSGKHLAVVHSHNKGKHSLREIFKLCKNGLGALLKEYLRLPTTPGCHFKLKMLMKFQFSPGQAITHYFLLPDYWRNMIHYL